MYSARGSIPADALDIILSMPEFYLYLVFVAVLLITALWTRETGPPVGEPCSTDLMTTGRSVADAPAGSTLQSRPVTSGATPASRRGSSGRPQGPPKRGKSLQETGQRPLYHSS
jgi:hypothetical protein